MAGQPPASCHMLTLGTARSGHEGTCWNWIRVCDCGKSHLSIVTSLIQGKLKARQPQNTKGGNQCFKCHLCLRRTPRSTQQCSVPLLGLHCGRELGQWAALKPRRIGRDCCSRSQPHCRITGVKPAPIANLIYCSRDRHHLPSRRGNQWQTGSTPGHNDILQADAQNGAASKLPAH